MLDLQTNILGTFHVLEAARAMRTPPSPLHLHQQGVRRDEQGRWSWPATRTATPTAAAGIGEETPLDFHSPYGCSKGAADQYVRDYARIYGRPTTVFRMSCIYGTRQFGTRTRVGGALRPRALRQRAHHHLRRRLQVRDILSWTTWSRAMRRRDGPHRRRGRRGLQHRRRGTRSGLVRGVIDYAARDHGRDVPCSLADWRPGDQRVYVSDTRSIERVLGWTPRRLEAGLERLVEWLHEADLPPRWWRGACRSPAWPRWRRDRATHPSVDAGRATMRAAGRRSGTYRVETPAARPGRGRGAHPPGGSECARSNLPLGRERVGCSIPPSRARRGTRGGGGRRRRRGRDRSSPGDRVAALSYHAYAEYDVCPARRWCRCRRSCGQPFPGRAAGAAP
jgi:nucleoside-diphosphate-sugar epimerase